jgi:toluene monooxygenase system protein D
MSAGPSELEIGMNKDVGPVLGMSDDIDAIIAAIMDDNPGKQISVVDRGAYTRISGEGELRVTRESIRRHLGRDFEMRQLEGVMSAFAGRIDITSDEVRWRLKPRAEPPAAGACAPSQSVEAPHD